MPIRTDLAIELLEAGGIPVGGMNKTEGVCRGVPLTRLSGVSGKFITMHLGRPAERSGASELCHALAEQLSELCGEIEKAAPVLVVGLGNRAVTPDALGPLCCDSVLATRHMKELSLRPVSVISCGVLGTTGIETGEVITGLLDTIAPQLIIAVDALAARRMGRLMNTIQLSDAGIIPGSGVGNARFALTRDELGIPVIAIGVPTVIDTATIAHDIAEQTGTGCPALDDLKSSAVITTNDADRRVAEAARLIGCGIDLFLHPELSLEDINAFIS